VHRPMPKDTRPGELNWVLTESPWRKNSFRGGESRGTTSLRARSRGNPGCGRQSKGNENVRRTGSGEWGVGKGEASPAHLQREENWALHQKLPTGKGRGNRIGVPQNRPAKATTEKVFGEKSEQRLGRRSFVTGDIVNGERKKDGGGRRK